MKRRVTNKPKILLAYLLIIFLSACSNQVVITSKTIVKIDSGLLTSSLIEGVDSQTSETNPIEIAVADFDGEAFSYFADELIVHVSDDAVLQQFLKRFGGTLLDDGSIPAPPSTIDPGKVRDIKDLGYKLIAIRPPTADPEALATKLESKSFSGTATFSSQDAANLFAFYLQINDEEFSEEFGSELTVEPNVLLEQTAYREHTTNSSNTTFYNPATAWWLSDSMTRVSSSNGAWTLTDYFLRPLDGRGVTIAVIDTGFNINGYDLVGIDPYSSTSVTSRTVSTYNFVNNTYNIPSVADCVTQTCWHGANVANVAAAARNNRYGRVGVAPNANLQLFRIATNGASYGQGGWYNAGRAVDTAVAWGADIINMSFIAMTPGAVGIPGTFLGAAIDRADGLGVINVAAMGNDNRYFNGGRLPWVTYPVPAVWSDVLSVGAINNNKWKSSYSNYGTDTDIFAPGGDGPLIDTAAQPDSYPSCYYSTSNFQCAFTANAYSQFNGTSAAAPIVSGVIALMLQANRSLTPDQIESILKSTARRDSFDPKVSRIVDARQAVLAVTPRP